MECSNVADGNTGPSLSGAVFCSCVALEWSRGPSQDCLLVHDVMRTEPAAAQTDEQLVGVIWGGELVSQCLCCSTGVPGFS